MFSLIGLCSYHPVTIIFWDWFIVLYILIIQNNYLIFSCKLFSTMRNNRLCIYVLFCADVPEFPQNESTISVVSTTHSTIVIQWKPAKTLPIATVTRYRIYVYNKNGFKRVYSTSDGNTLNYTIKELRSSTLYKINIIAINDLGQSSPTTIITVLTKTFGKYVIKFNEQVYFCFLYSATISTNRRSYLCVFR